MARAPLDSSNIKIEQKAALSDEDLKDRSDFVIADASILEDKEYSDLLAFNEEPVTILLHPSSDKNAATLIPAWSNGKGAEVFMNGRWVEVTYLPTGMNVTVKRKIAEVLLRSKIDTVNTVILGENSESPLNRHTRVTSSANALSIVRDDNPRGAAWAEEMLRRNF